MSLLNPQKGYVDWWENEVLATAGRFRQEIILYDDNTAEIVHDSNAMGLGKERCFLMGRHKTISPDYGWIYIDSIRKSTDNSLEQFQPLSVSDFEGGIVLEYFRIPRSPHVQHPHDMMNDAAQWIEHFDILVIVQPFIDELIGGFRDMFAHPSEYEGDDLPDQNTVEAVIVMLSWLDKQKFTHIEGSQSND